MDADLADLVACTKFDVNPLRDLDFGTVKVCCLPQESSTGPYNIAVTTALHVITSPSYGNAQFSDPTKPKPLDQSG